MESALVASVTVTRLIPVFSKMNIQKLESPSYLNFSDIHNSALKGFHESFVLKFVLLVYFSDARSLRAGHFHNAES